MLCEIQNTYLTSEFRERVWIVASPGFGSESGQCMIVKKVLCWFKISGASLRARLEETLETMGYKPRYADPYVWIRSAGKPNGFQYYEYMLWYVDDVLCISADTGKYMNGIQDDFKLKSDKIEEPYA